MIHCDKICDNVIGQYMLVVISYSDIHLLHFSRNPSTKTRISSQNSIEDRTEYCGTYNQDLRSPRSGSDYMSELYITVEERDDEVYIERVNYLQSLTVGLISTHRDTIVTVWTFRIIHKQHRAGKAQLMSKRFVSFGFCLTSQ